GLGPVELECGIQAAVGPEAPIVEQGGTEAGALHPLQELLRNDLVGVHVGARQRGHGAGVADERLDHDAARSRSPSLSHAHSRTSTIRPLVQEPRNTRSIGSPARGVPGSRPMYSRARDTARRSSSVGKSAGSGTAPVTLVTMPGLVPQVTWGGTRAASSVTQRSYVAPGSLWSPRHAATAPVHAAPVGARGRPAR